MKQELSKGTILDNRYRIEDKMGQGGFAISYLAYDLKLEQNIVIKEYFPYTLAERDQDGYVHPVSEEKASYFSEGKERFLKEAKVQAALFEIPGVVKVLGYIEAFDTIYEVMEWVNGVTLRKYVEDNGEVPDFQEAYQMLEPIFNALAVIHEKDCIHRDISPDNIMVQSDGRIKLLDFGAARAYLANLDQDKTMTIYIKDGFTPLEQYDAHGKQGPWTDIYALSAVLYYLMTGYTPENARQRQLNDTLFTLSEFGCIIDPETEQKIMKRALAVEADDRYHSIAQMKKDLFEQPLVKEPKKESWKVLVPVLLTICGIVVVFSIFGLKWKQSMNLQEVTIAGDYPRSSEKYQAFMDMVKDNAVSVEETDDGTKYTLTEKAVLEWGEPCNQTLMDFTQEDAMEKWVAAGNSFDVAKEKESYYVVAEAYGHLDTVFIKQTQYDISDGCYVGVSYDLVSGKVEAIAIYQKDQDSDTLCHSAAQMAFAILDLDGDSSELEGELKETYATHATKLAEDDVIMYEELKYWCDNSKYILLWDYDETYGYGLILMTNFYQ